MHLRPGVSGRRSHTGRGVRPQPDLSRVREHRRLCGVLRQTRSQRDLARHRFGGGSGGCFPALLQRGEPSAGTGSEHARPGRRTVSCDRSSTLLRRRRPSRGRRSPPPCRCRPGPTPSRWSAPLRTASTLASTPWPSVLGVRRPPSPHRPDPWEGGSGGSTPIPTTTHRRAGRDSPVPPAKP